MLEFLVCPSSAIQSTPTRHPTLCVRLLLFSKTSVVHSPSSCRRYKYIKEECAYVCTRRWSKKRPVANSNNRKHSARVLCFCGSDWIANGSRAQWDDAALTGTSVIFPKRTEFLGVRQFVLQY